MDEVIQVAYKQELLHKISISSYHSFSCQKYLEKQLDVSRKSKVSVICPRSVPIDKAHQLRDNIDGRGFKVGFSRALAKDEPLPTFSDIQKVFSQEKTELKHQNGEVLLIDVWATWCGPCQDPMKHNQKMLESNEEKWKGKVRIVGVSVDEDKKTIIERVKEEGWTKIEHLTILGRDQNHPIMKDFEIQGIPFVCLVNKSGKIDYVGHPHYIDLEKRINQLLEQSEVEEPKVQTPEKIISQQQVKSLIEQVKRNYSMLDLVTSQNVKKVFGNSDVFLVMGEIRTSVESDKVDLAKSTMRIWVQEQESHLIEEFKSLFKEFDISNIQITQNIVKSTLVPNIDKAVCIQCNVDLKYPFYWCRWDSDPNTFRCRECVQKKPSEEGKHFHYEQNSILLNGPWKKIALKGMGNNIQPKDLGITPKQVNQYHDYGCNGCGSLCLGPDFSCARYICLGCRNDPNIKGDYIDISQKCLNEYLNRNEAVRAKLDKHQHKENHPLLRVLYNLKGYYNY